jgi:chaperonin GroES
MEFKQKLLNDLIVVEMLTESASKGGVAFVEYHRPMRGRVVAVGPGKALPYGERAPMECAVGDTVVFAPTAGMDMSYGVGQNARIMRDSDVDAVLA